MESNSRGKLRDGLLVDPIIKALGLIVSYSIEIGSDIDMLICHSMAELGYNDIIDDCICIKNDIVSSINKMCKDGVNMVTSPHGGGTIKSPFEIKNVQVFLTDRGRLKSEGLAEKDFLGLIRKDCPNVRDKRDEVTWVVIELSPLGENKLEEGTIEQIIRKNMGIDKNHPMFIPKATYQEDNQVVSLHLLDGYIFIQSGLQETSYLKLEHTPYVSRVLSKIGSDGIRVLSVIPNKNVEEMKEQISCLSVSDLARGDPVVAIDGMYKGLDFTVMEIMGDRAMVKSSGLRSIDIITTIPLNSLSSIK